jgi:DNA-binding transcriptional ArsR family regulator
MGSTTDFAVLAALMGDPARASILDALMDGRALTATELARCAGVAPQTASSHLAKLSGAGLITASQQGRYRYFRISSPAVASIIEQLWTLSDELAAARRSSKPVVVGPRDPALRFARTCYDHLAGSLAVQISDGLVQRGFLELSMEGAALTRPGIDHLVGLGARINPDQARGPGIFCRPCLDWSERRPHLAGAVGAAICTLCFEKGWLGRSSGRTVTLTPKGRLALRTSLLVTMDVQAGDSLTQADAALLERALP